MTRSNRLPRAAHVLDQASRCVFSGTAILAFAFMITGPYTGIAGDAFVAIADETHVYLAIMLIAAMTLYAMYGAILVVRGLIAAVVHAPAVIRTIMRTRHTAR